MKRRILMAVAAMSVATVLAACGQDTTTSPTTADHNDADVTFATMMIPHHQQAVQMAQLAATRATDPDVKDLAAQINSAQEPEIATMTGWLQQWGEEVPAESTDGMGGMDHSMPGMMTDEQMMELEGQSGAAFDTMFLTMMRQHHQGAIQMATTEQDDGTYQPAVELAGQIIKAQTAEIATIEELLKGK